MAPFGTAYHFPPLCRGDYKKGETLRTLYSSLSSVL